MPEGIGHYITPVQQPKFLPRRGASAKEAEQLRERSELARAEAAERLNWAVLCARVGCGFISGSADKAECAGRVDGRSESVADSRVPVEVSGDDGAVSGDVCGLENGEDGADGRGNGRGDRNDSGEKHNKKGTAAKLCPCCGNTKNLEKVLGQSMLTVAVAAQRVFQGNLKKNGIELKEMGHSLVCCSSCRASGQRALEVAKHDFPLCTEFERKTSKKTGAPVLPPRPITCGKTTLVCKPFPSILIVPIFT